MSAEVARISLEVEREIGGEWKEITLIVTAGYYSAGCAPVYYLRNGDPGHPGEDEEISDIVARAFEGGPEIKLSEKEYEQAEEKLLEAIHAAREDSE